MINNRYVGVCPRACFKWQAGVVANLKLQRQVAASIMKCGKRKVWIDPTLTPKTGTCVKRKEVRKLISNAVILKRNHIGASRKRCRKYNEAKLTGSHTGIGKRRGTAEARSPSKTNWIFKLRVLRRLLKKYRETKKIDKALYHSLYLKVKGNVFKNKRVLVEHIHKAKLEAVRLKTISKQIDALRVKKRNVRERRIARNSKKDSANPTEEPAK